MQAFSTMASVTIFVLPRSFRGWSRCSQSRLQPMLFGYDGAHTFREHRLTGGHQAGITHRDTGGQALYSGSMLKVYPGTCRNVSRTYLEIESVSDMLYTR